MKKTGLLEAGGGENSLSINFLGPSWGVCARDLGTSPCTWGSPGMSQGAAVERTTAEDEPPNILGKSKGTKQGAAVQRTTAEDVPPSMFGKSSGMAQGAPVQWTTAVDELPRM